MNFTEMRDTALRLVGGTAAGSAAEAAGKELIAALDALAKDEPTGEKVNPFPGQSLAVGAFDDPGTYTHEHVQTSEQLDRATLVTSVVRCDQGWYPALHKIVLDVDHPVKVLESSTPGHHHLFIDKPMSWDRYRAVLEALTLAGVVEPGYLGISEQRGYTAVRLPWVKKDQPEAAA